MRSSRFLTGLFAVICHAGAAQAGLDGSVYLMPVDTSFSSVGEAVYINALQQIDYSAALSGEHKVTHPGTVYTTPVAGSGSYSGTLGGSAQTGVCYGTSLHVIADPPGWFNEQEQTWTGDEKCAPGAIIVRPPGYDDPELDVNPSNPSPILVDLDGNGFHLAGTDDAVNFDIDADGDGDMISWTAMGESDAFLALDRDQNGTIDDGKELFGTATRLNDGTVAPNGYVALAEFDAVGRGGNGDSTISPADAVWGALLLWRDGNHNGLSEPDEMTSLSAAGLLSLDVEYVEAERRDPHGNRFRYKSQAELTNPGGRKHASQTYDVFFVSAP